MTDSLGRVRLWLHPDGIYRGTPESQVPQMHTGGQVVYESQDVPRPSPDRLTEVPAGFTVSYRTRAGAQAEYDAASQIVARMPRLSPEGVITGDTPSVLDAERVDGFTVGLVCVAVLLAASALAMAVWL